MASATSSPRTKSEVSRDTGKS